MTLRVLVHTPLNRFTGYGQDGVGLVEAMMRRGWDVYLQPECVSPPLPQPVADLMTKPLEAPFDLRLEHWAPDNLELAPNVAEASSVNLAWSMWEFTSLRNAASYPEFRENTQHFDAIVGYDENSQQAFAEAQPDVPVHVLQGGFDPALWRPVERDWTGERFAFCMVGVLNERKNPFIAIEAFKALKEERPEEFAGAELHLKTNAPGLHPLIEKTVPKLRIHRATWPHDVLQAFYGEMHCLLAPSRGEGKNVPALEFMTTGGVVVATNWGGHTQWLSGEYAYPLPASLKQVPYQPDVLWADVRVEDLKAAMWSAFTNRTEAREKAARAQQVIPRMCSWDAVLDRFVQRLPGWVPGGRGEHLLRLDAERTQSGASGLLSSVLS